MTAPNQYAPSHLQMLEAESIYIIREVVAQMERPALLFSGGKDSAVLLHLAMRRSIRPRYRYRSCTSTPATTSPK